MVVVLIVENAPRGLRGELSRWLIEPKAGVFVGNVSALVRDRLWERLCREAAPVSGLLIVGARTEQKFSIRVHGDPSRDIVEVEGLQLVRVKTEAKHKRR
ncbi:MAG TPA: type I-E CRISPR-associated endoribonuclease Cas2 [Armatimonadetes bacterium]|nr:type I-E CRISPR-associated endoribonuclease Cas2 [Armatimonadota bacterium]